MTLDDGLAAAFTRSCAQLVEQRAAKQHGRGERLSVARADERCCARLRRDHESLQHWRRHLDHVSEHDDGTFRVGG